MTKLFLGILVCAVCACTNNSTQSPVAEDSASSQTPHAAGGPTGTVGAVPMNLNGCYQMTLKRDTANLTLTVQDTLVTGDLNYRWAEKDANMGTLNGVLRQDTIYADYTFQSEGTTSVREVIFKIKDGTLLQGFGDITEQNGKIVFQNRSTLQFQTANPFIKVACR